MSTFSTERLKQLVGYAIKGAGFNNYLELSGYIGISIAESKLYLNTTDGTNYVCVSDGCIADDMDVVVNADLFAKLINKIKTDTVDMEVVGNALVITGNGKYTLELIPNDAGEPLVFPDKFPVTTEKIGELSADALVSINSAIKASLGTDVGSVYTSYYFGDVIASTDRKMASIFNLKVFDKPYLLNREFVDLLVMSGTDSVLSIADNTLVAETAVTGGCVISVCTKIQEDVSDFNIDGINNFAAIEVKSFCRIYKVELLDLLDRLALFVGKFDEGAIQMSFGTDSVEISSIASTGVEKIEYAESKDAQPITIKVNIDRLRNQLRAYSSDVVDLYYGSDICIKLVDKDVTQIIALMK